MDETSPPASLSSPEPSGQEEASAPPAELNETLEFEPSLQELFIEQEGNMATPEEVNAMMAELNLLKVQLQNENASKTALQAELLQLQNRMHHIEAGGSNTPRPGILKPDTFGQKDHESWPNFRRRFEHCARFNMWNEDQQKLALVNAMIGKAADAIQDLKVEQFHTAADLLNAYEKRFMPAAQSDIVRIQFDRCRQNARESVLEYHSRLRALYRRAYPQSTDDIQLIRRFAFGLANPMVQQMVLRNQPKTYDDALEAALNESAVMDVAGALRTGTASLGNPLPSTTGLHPTDGTPEPMEIGALGSNECMFCGKPGHWKSRCQLWQKAQRLIANRRGRGRGIRNPPGPDQGGRSATGFRGRANQFRGRGRTNLGNNGRERQRSMFRQIVAALQKEDWGEDEEVEPAAHVAAIDQAEWAEEGAPEEDDLDGLVASMTDEEIDELFQTGFA